MDTSNFLMQGGVPKDSLTFGNDVDQLVSAQNANFEDLPVFIHSSKKLSDITHETASRKLTDPIDVK